ncbi:ubiquinone biosynthesis protein COQ9 [Sphingobium sp. OAS761]|uniref:COQ9 family protein n=1 Tax=Sphingobium sp. OAS761 TaxID=2817901 RepID=UPI00209F995D|nr:COQ9 family protein [Sphingobium sp. OAS761]MCP1469969.1 ubiquinone biosynthesis protein COQ9 [Sphingobium sp. OAS761]
MTEDLTLDELRATLAPLLPRHAAFDGWRPQAVDMAARERGIDPDIARLAFADGAMGMIDAWFAAIDTAMLNAVPAAMLDGLSVRRRILALVEARLDLLAPEREALRRALAVLAMPVNARRAAALGWRAADTMWRAAGDSATSFAHYSKRATLSAVYAATLLVFLDDESAGQADSRAFLARRIEGVMRFEKFKAGVRNAGGGERLSLSRFIGRLRYPAV